MSIYSCFTGKSFEDIEKEFDGKGYGDFKLAVGETVADSLAPLRENFDALMKDKAYLESVMRSGAETASRIAAKTIAKVHKKLGFVGI
jgi:tryptophanyl-tRNA synthetase